MGGPNPVGHKPVGGAAGTAAASTPPAPRKKPEAEDPTAAAARGHTVAKALGGIVRHGPGGPIHAKEITVTVTRGGKTGVFRALQPLPDSRATAPDWIKAGFGEEVGLILGSGTNQPVRMSKKDAEALMALYSSPPSIEDLSDVSPIRLADGW